MIGKILGERYEILSRLGGGGMALVYKGRDIRLNRLITIKVLRPEYTSDKDFIRRFNREAQSVAVLSHPNIVSLYDGGQEDEIYYLVMEYVQGENLKDLINRSGSLSIEKALDITLQVCDALAHAHDHKIIHRDIKPHNILISNTGVVKLTDFGIALETGTSTLSDPDTVLGSVHYISPEQAKGKEAIVASDIYSLGIVLYEMLTGRLPFNGDSPIAIALAQIQDTPVLPSRLNPAVPSCLERLILQALAKNPEDRFVSARDLAAKIKQFYQNSNFVSSFTEEDNNETRVLNSMEDENSDTRAFNKQEYRASLNENSTQVRNNQWSNHHQYKSGWNQSTGEPVHIARSDNYHPSSSSPGSPQPKSSNRFLKVLVILIILTIIAGTAIFLKAVLSGGVVNKDNSMEKSNSMEIELPDWKNKSDSEAVDFLKNNSLTYEIAEEYHDTIEEGRVISQRPEAGTYVTKGEKVNLVISLGKPPVSVPNLIGKSMREAESVLQERGLTLKEGSWRDYSTTVPAGNICDQNPRAGSEIRAGESVMVNLSLGIKKSTETEEKVHVPSFTGKTLAEAEIVAAEHGLSVFKSSKSGNSLVVTAQSPGEGASVLPGSSISLIFGTTEDEKADESDGEDKEKNADRQDSENHNKDSEQAGNNDDNNNEGSGTAKNASLRVDAPKDMESSATMNAYLYDDQYSGKLIYTYEMGVRDYVVFNFSYWGTARVEIYLGDNLYEVKEFN